VLFACFLFLLYSFNSFFPFFNVPATS